MKKLFSVLLVTVLALGLGACTSKKDDANTGADDNRPEKLVMGFVPSSNSDTIADTVEPLAELLSQRLDIEVEGRVMTNYNALVEAMGTNEVQIGFVPSFAYVVANEEYGVEVILKSERYGSGSYVGQYLVRTDSGIDTMDDLRGKVWAYGDATSTSGFLFPASQIIDLYSDVTDPTTDFFSDTVESGSHDNSIIAVMEGNADVATTFDDARVLVSEDYPNIMTDTKVIGYTDPIPNDTISVTKELDDELVQEIREAFYGFNANEDMLAIMKDVYSWDAIALAEDSEYDVVRSTYNKFKDSINLGN
ncbi:phosphate/phosphite/phosphonate ABC transporter substrate-binding protein [Haloplasma contractile]|uniref:Phosphonate ABC transporter phosphonate-binding protein putative n=1 Tax=Haloplasma contractile SSD-17B TaxID=1033810 RepID=F7Q147_9MOLU|nr:phosphate/phosphite/phosphonate ABC transporter substrate-binding protein [Haloplasma contractile]ERJ11311.1 Phosphonate ABC transporter phosphonate-binding protein putative [Haloplasma contractile SSD-17B]